VESANRQGVDGLVQCHLAMICVGRIMCRGFKYEGKRTKTVRSKIVLPTGISGCIYLESVQINHFLTFFDKNSYEALLVYFAYRCFTVPYIPVLPSRSTISTFRLFTCSDGDGILMVVKSIEPSLTRDTMTAR